MARYDLALFHAPSVFDFRQKTMFKGPVSEVVPSLYVFDMYPYGFLTLASWLSKKGMRVGIFNLAAKMVLDPNYDPLHTIKRVEASVYGVDLHWLVHAHGALEVARLLKDSHPESRVILGGISASYYWREILERYSFVDAVVLGDTTEESMEELVRRAESGRGFGGIPGVAWRDSGRIRLEPPREPPEDLDPYAVDHSVLVKMALRERDLGLIAPCASFIQAPIAAVLTVKGCQHNCVTCGGSREAFKRIFGRERVALKSPEAIAEEASSISSMSRMTIFILGDLRMGRGEEGSLEVLRALKKADLDNPLMFEFFYPASRRLLEAIRALGDDVYIQISPESQDEDIRRAFGRMYGNAELEKMVRLAGELEFKRLDLYFMTGLPKQTYGTAIRVADYFSRLVEIHGTAEGIDAFTAPLAPFLDPGSLAFEKPEAYGYKLLFRDLESHRRALEEPHWGLTLNYRTIWMDRPEVVEASLTASLRLAEAKRDMGLIGDDIFEAIRERISFDRQVYARLRSGPLTPEEEAELKEKAMELALEKELIINKELYPSAPLSECLRLPQPLGTLVAKLLGAS